MARWFITKVEVRQFSGKSVISHSGLFHSIDNAFTPIKKPQKTATRSTVFHYNCVFCSISWDTLQKNDTEIRITIKRKLAKSRPTLKDLENILSQGLEKIEGSLQTPRFARIRAACAFAKIIREPNERHLQKHSKQELFFNI